MPFRFWKIQKRNYLVPVPVPGLDPEDVPAPGFADVKVYFLSLSRSTAARAFTGEM